MFLNFYRFSMDLLYAASFPYLARRYREGFDERRGFYSKEFQDMVQGDRPLWIHAVSVGEVQSSLPFISEIRKEDPLKPVILSTITPTGKKMFDRLLNGKVDAHFYYPWDVSRIVNRALNTIQPEAYITLETEIWPTLLSELSKRGVPCFMVNGRFSDKSFEKMERFRFIWREVLCLYTLIMVREREDETKLLKLGVPRDKIVHTGDCKVDALLERRDHARLEEVRKLTGPGKPIFLGGSTHNGEDQVVLQAFDRVRRKIPSARLILVPRHPERAGAVRELAEKYGRSCLLSGPLQDWSILIVDRIGVLFELYGICDGAFIGGSLVPKGGQNLMEAAAFGVPVTHGPHMEDFAEASKRMGELGISSLVTKPDDLSEEWLRTSDPGVREKISSRCIDFFSELGGAASSSWKLIREHMDKGGK